MANSYLTRTFGTPTDTKKYTMSVWVKRSKLGVQQSIARSTNGNDDSHIFTFNSDDTLRMDEYGSSSSIGKLVTNRKFRDTSAWYHVVLWYDSANGTAGDRMRMWINGVEETSFSTDTNPSVNAASAFNKASQPINIGRTSYGSGGNYFDGYLAHMAFVDGSTVAHTTFGETDSTSGIWKFKSPSGVTWGNNGFHLKFENSGALGTDSSGNSNTFSVFGDLKQALDTPSNVNATLNPLNYTSSAITYSNGNNKATYPGAWMASLGTMGVQAGKYYWEAKVVSGNNANLFYGISTDAVDLDTSPQNKAGVISQHINGDRYVDTTYTAGAAQALVNGDILGVALDLDSGTKTVKFYKNGSLLTSSSSINLTSTFDNEFVFPIFIGNNSSASSIWEVNFGNGFFGTTAITSAGSNGNGSLFEYDVPSGFYALNTKNINTYG